MHVRDSGSGPPVLLLHGQPGTGGDWSAVIERLAGEHRVIAPDRPGYGESRGPARGLAANADALATVLDDLEVDEVTVAGHSWGGGVALALAQRHPDRVRALVLAASIGAPSSLDLVDRVLALPFIGDALAFAGLRVFSPVVLVPRVRSAIGPVARPVPTAQLRPRVREWQSGSTWRSFVVEQRAMVAELPAISERLDAVTVPTIVVVGKRDKLLPTRAGADLAAAIPGSRLVEIPDAGHALPLEAPTELSSLIRQLHERGD